MSVFFFFFKQKTAYEMRISDWSSDVCSSDLQTLTAPCFRLLSLPTENWFVCFRTGAVRQQKKWGPQRDPRKFRAGIGGKLSSSDAPQGTPSSDKGLLHALQGLAAVLGPVEVGEQFRGAAVVVGGGHLEAHARAAVAAAHV